MRGSRTVLGLLLAGIGGCQSEAELWIAPPDAPSGAKTVFWVASQDTRSGVYVQALASEGALKVPLDLSSDEPALLQAVFTPYTPLQLGLAEGGYQRPAESASSLGLLESEVFWLEIASGLPGPWQSGELREPAVSLPLKPDLCPEFEFERLSYDSRFVIPIDENRAALIGPNDFVRFEWKNDRVETTTIALAGEGAAGEMGLFEDENTYWFGGTHLSRLVLEPRSFSSFADFGRHVVRDFVLERGGALPAGLVITSDGALFEVDGSTVTDLGRIPGERGSIGAAGFAVAEEEGRVFAAASGGAVLFEYSATGVEQVLFGTTDAEALAFGANFRGLGPTVLSRRLGYIFVRSAEQAWELEAQLEARVRRGADFEGGVMFFDDAGVMVYYSRKAGVCHLPRAPWAGDGRGAPVGPVLLVSALDTGSSYSSWIVRKREAR